MSSDLAQIVLNKLGGHRQPCRPGCRAHASCIQDGKIQDVIEAARETLEDCPRTQDVPRYWEDDYAERLQAKLPPGYRAEPRRGHPLRDQDAEVRILDGEGVPMGSLTDEQRRVIGMTSLGGSGIVHSLIARAWKRFLDRGI